MDSDKTLDSLWLRFKAIKVFGRIAVVSFDRGIKVEMCKAIVNLVSKKVETKSEEGKI